MPAEKIEFSRWLDADWDERCLQKVEIGHSVLASGARCLRRLMNSACVEVVNRFILKSPLAISHCIKVDLMLLFFI